MTPVDDELRPVADRRKATLLKIVFEDKHRIAADHAAENALALTRQCGHREYLPMMEGLREVFRRHQHDGAVVFPYRTLVYFGQLKPAA